ncbi:hemolysin family protein [Pseudoclostridium thermosuccinogenes]|uniref:hemolysin family protein n=1 Tax=Clostridium thermosuccinogenes TaxID=84032 RepID=UPI001FA93064|nr:hemolysin family protein [Pseudoclostridium thermosuccinogenes]
MSEGDSIFWQLVLQLILILINAIFACAEIAVISMNDTKLSKLASKGNKRAKRLVKLTEQPSRFLATIQVGITFAGFLGSAFAADNFSDKLVNWLVGMGVEVSVKTLDTISVIVITLILSYFTLVLGELVPKRIAMKKADELALAISGLVYFISKIFAPLVSLLTASTNGILKLLGIDPNAEDDRVTEEEIRMMVQAGSEKGTIDQDEKEMIQNVFEFDDKTAGDIMTHRTEVSLLWLEESDEQWEKTITESRHTMYPVCDGSTDNIIGVLNTKDYFRIKEKNRDIILKKAVKPAYFVPDTVRTDVLFRNMKKSRHRFAIVLDEYGGMDGIVTMSDILEQLVGDLEYDDSVPEKRPSIERVDSHTWKVLGSPPLETVSECLGIALPLDDYDTFGGLVFGLLGYIPEDGSTPEIEEYGLLIKVLEIKEHQLEKAIIYLQQKPEDDDTKE